MDGNIALSDEVLKECVEKYADIVFRVSYQHVCNRQDAEDVVQEVFLSLVERLRVCPFNDEEHLKAWLLRVAINKSINVAKHNARRRTERIIDNKMSGRDGAYDELDDELKKLPADDRQIIYLHYYEGYAAKEIAQYMGLRENTVHKRLSRAREKLKKYLTEEE